MKTVLIIADLNHSTPRIPGLAKYLPKYSWQTIIVSPPCNRGANLDNTKVFNPAGVKSGYGHKRITSTWLQPIRPFLKRLYYYWKQWKHYPDIEYKWSAQTLITALNLIRTQQVDAVLSSSSPVSSHLVARTVKAYTHLPWIADFRDPWIQNFAYPYGDSRRRKETKLELETMTTADDIVTVSDIWAQNLGELHHRQVHTIHNGYDTDNYNGNSPDLTPEFTITHTGVINENREYEKFEEGLNQFPQRDNINVRLYGPQHTLLPHTEVAQKQRESQLLLLLKYKTNDRGYYTGKIYEYLAAQRPILSIGELNDSISDLLVETNAGVEANTPTEITEALAHFYNEFKRIGKVSYHGNLLEIAKYSYLEMAKKYSAILGENA